jgi:hypothetical protein
MSRAACIGPPRAPIGVRAGMIPNGIDASGRMLTDKGLYRFGELAAFTAPEQHPRFGPRGR